MPVSMLELGKECGDDEGVSTRYLNTPLNASTYARSPKFTFNVGGGSDSTDRIGIKWKPEQKQWRIMISLSFISFMVSLDSTILVTVLPGIAQSLHGSAAEAFWTGTSYLLTSAVFQPVIASLSTHFGRQPLLYVSIAFFTSGTVLSATASNFAIMLIGRCLQGVGGGGIITITQLVFCDIVPLIQRPKYFSMVLGSWSIGSILGPFVGGCLAEKLSWRWCFYINFPFCIIGFVVSFLFVRLPPVPFKTFETNLKEIDWIGALLFVSSMTGFLVGISWGGIQYPWWSSETLAPILAGILGIVIFWKWQVLRHPYPLLPTSLFYNISSFVVYYCALVNGIVLYTALYYVPFYLMSVRGLSPVRTGVNLFPAVCLLVPGSVVVGFLTSHLDRFRWAIWIGWVITTVACGLLILFDLHTRTVVFVVLAVFGIGNGMVLTGVNIGTLAIAKIDDHEAAACMYGFMRSLGMPVGVAVSGTVFQNTMSHALSKSSLPVDIAQDSARYISVLWAMAETDPMKIAILECYTKGFHAVFTTLTSISASALVLSLLIKHFSMCKSR